MKKIIPNHFKSLKMNKRKDNLKNNNTSTFIQLRGIDAKKEIEFFLNNEKIPELESTIVNFFSKLYFTKNISRDKTDKELQNKYTNKNYSILSNGISLQKLNESNNKFVCFWDRHSFDWQPVKIPFSKIGRHPLNIIPNAKKTEEFICAYEFCSYECQYAYIISLIDKNSNINPVLMHAYYYMQKQFQESYPNEQLIPSNDPILIIGNSSQGIMPIDEYRKNLKRYINLNSLFRHTSYPVFQVSEQGV